MTEFSFDLARARQDTPGCEKVLHFNNAGASLTPRPVLEAAINYLRLEAEMGGYEAADFSRETVERVYDSIGALIGCDRNEVAVIENATRAWNMAFYSIPFKAGDRILTAKVEYASNYIALLQVARRTGAMIEIIPNDESGQVSVEALQNMLDERVKLIAITHVPTNGGLVNPAAEIGRVAQEAGVLYLLDACQSVGQMPINVETIGCDMLSVTGRKFLRGPRGTGFLYVRREVIEQLEPPFLDLHSASWPAPDRFEIRPDARRFENWETNYAAKIGLGVAVDYALSWGLDNIGARVAKLAEKLRATLSDIPGVEVRDLGRDKCGIVTFTIEGHPAGDVRRQLAERKINVSISTVGSTRLDMEERGLPEVVRASVHYYNSESEVERFGEAIYEIL